MSVNPDAVLALVDVDMSSMVAFITKGDKSAIRMRDGRPPTAEQLELLMGAGRAEMEAARDLAQRYAEAARDDAAAATRAGVLMRKYARHGKEPAKDVMPRMSPLDRAEFIHLMELIT